MILNYSFYIFMIIIKVSNSINQNYAVIYNAPRFTEEIPHYNGAYSYSRYYSIYHQFDLQSLDPQDFFLSIYSPYYYFLPSPSITQYSKHTEYVTQSMRKLFYFRKKDMKYSLTAHQDDLRLSGVDPLYWYPKRPKFYKLNMNITSVYALHNLTSIYCRNVQDYDPWVTVQQTYMNSISDKKAPKMDNKPILDIYDIMTFKKVIEKKIPNDAFAVAPEFNILTEYEFSALNKLTSYLPITEDYSTRSNDTGPSKKEEPIDDYLKRHYETVKEMSTDRVKNLKLR
ncbi:uncharacterized protein LOC100570090 [Acyrthosiphon pisum]|uniref:Uncharacterized protein n=1 Tax=Acyrthosiphon pisum TaxID=7029 RepID=A0A8R2NTI8_ACYPI|nr:uncharacterized protein LOC100570090 [Acyrthosiphon pisum]